MLNQYMLNQIIGKKIIKKYVYYKKNPEKQNQ